MSTQKFTLAFFAAIIFLVSCKNDPANSGQGAGATAESEHASAKTLAGHWIAMDFCSRAGQYGSVLQSMNNAHLPYAYAFNFDYDHLDSVTCYDGTKSWKLSTQITGDTIELKNAFEGKSIFFMYDPATKDLTLFDNAKTGKTQMDRFIKSKADASNAYQAFSTALNHNLLQGQYTAIGQKAEKPVMFTPGGYIQNFAPYDRYILCTAGDCFLLGDKMDVITVGNSKVENSKKMYGIGFSRQLDSLYFYNMITQGEGKAAQLGTKAYTFVRVKTPESKPATK